MKERSDGRKMFKIKYNIMLRSRDLLQREKKRNTDILKYLLLIPYNKPLIVR